MLRMDASRTRYTSITALQWETNPWSSGPLFLPFQYAVETWTMYRRNIKRLKRLELTKLRWILRINWKYRLPNHELLYRIFFAHIKATNFRLHLTCHMFKIHHVWRARQCLYGRSNDHLNTFLTQDIFWYISDTSSLRRRKTPRRSTIHSLGGLSSPTIDMRRIYDVL